MIRLGAEVVIPPHRNPFRGLCPHPVEYRDNEFYYENNYCFAIRGGVAAAAAAPSPTFGASSEGGPPSSPSAVTIQASTAAADVAVAKKLIERQALVAQYAKPCVPKGSSSSSSGGGGGSGSNASDDDSGSGSGVNGKRKA